MTTHSGAQNAQNPIEAPGRDVTRAVHGVFRENTRETREVEGGRKRPKSDPVSLPDQIHGVLPELRDSVEPQRCGAKTRRGSSCARFPAQGRARCRLHGGASTGPKTPEGRQRISNFMRERYVRAALADGWRLLEESLRVRIRRLMHALRGSKNATATTLGITNHGLRRALTPLPLRPEEYEAIHRALRT